MSNQPYEPYEPYDPHEAYDRNQQQPHHEQWPDSGAADPQPYAQSTQHTASAPDTPSTQTFQGNTWDTQHPQTQQHPQPQPYAQSQPYAQPQNQPHPQPQVNAADTAYLPPQNYGAGPLPPYDEAPAPAAAPTAPAAAAARDFGPATTTGNPRITDAQRARAEGRSPIIEPGMRSAALTAALGLLLAGGAALGPYALLVPLLVLQALTAAGWFRLNGMWPARQGIALAFLGGVTADAAVLAAGRENAPAAILGTLGVWVLLTLVLQLRSHAAADERMYGLMATVTSAALAVVAAGFLAADGAAVSVGAAAVAVAALARALPLPAVASVVVALLAAAGAGIAVGGMTDLGSGGALLGLGAGVCALIGLRVASYDYPSRFVHMTAGIALPLTAAAPALYLLGRALV